MQLPKEALYALVAGVVGLLFAAFMAKKVLAADRGNEKMREIQDNIADGAMAFLRREYKSISIFVVAVAVILLVALQGDIAGLGWKTALAFVMGAVCSSICGFGGMKIATAANARTTQAATRSFNEALNVAFPGGVVGEKTNRLLSRRWARCPLSSRMRRMVRTAESLGGSARPSRTCAAVASPSR